MKHLNPKVDLPSPAIVLAIVMRVLMYPKCTRKCYREIDDFCWLFIQGDKITDGRDGCRYPTITFNGATWLVHRTMWEFLHQRKMPEDLKACHMCDRPMCCNPFHIEPGTDKKNSDDYHRRVRNAAKEERNGAHTHPEKRPKGERVVELEIREDIAGLIKGCLEIMGTDIKAIFSIASHYGATAYIVQQAASGEIWRNVKAVTPKVLPRVIDIDPDLL